MDEVVQGQVSVDKDIEEVAAVLQENSASFEEIATTSDIQAEVATEIFNSMVKTKDIARGLESLTVS